MNLDQALFYQRAARDKGKKTSSKHVFFEFTRKRFSVHFKQQSSDDFTSREGRRNEFIECHIDDVKAWHSSTIVVVKIKSQSLFTVHRGDELGRRNGWGEGGRAGVLEAVII